MTRIKRIDKPLPSKVFADLKPGTFYKYTEDGIVFLKLSNERDHNSYEVSIGSFGTCPFNTFVIEQDATIEVKNISC